MRSSPFFILLAFRHVIASAFSNKHADSFLLPNSVSRRQDSSVNITDGIPSTEAFPSGNLIDIQPPTNGTGGPGRMLGAQTSSSGNFFIGLSQDDSILITLSKCAAQLDQVLGPCTFINGSQGESCTWRNIWDDAYLNRHYSDGIGRGFQYQFTHFINNNLAAGAQTLDTLVGNMTCQNSSTPVTPETEGAIIHDEFRRRLQQLYPALDNVQMLVIVAIISSINFATLSWSFQWANDNLRANTTFIADPSFINSAGGAVITSMAIFGSLQRYFAAQNMAQVQARMENPPLDGALDDGIPLPIFALAHRFAARTAAAGLVVRLNVIINELVRAENRRVAAGGDGGPGGRRRQVGGQASQLTCLNIDDWANAATAASETNIADANFIPYANGIAEVKKEAGETCPAP